MKRAIIIAFLAFGSPARACEIALVLGVDVSNSIDAFEYDLQVRGMAEALSDPVIEEALISMQASIAVVQWSGMGEQQISVSWTRVRGPQDLGQLQTEIAMLSRPFTKSDTAVGEALASMVALLDLARNCGRRVIDFAGDGINNAGEPPSDVRAQAVADGIVINGLGIDRVGLSVTQYYRNNVIGGRGSFVMTAKGYRDFPQAIKAKLLRELVKPVS